MNLKELLEIKEDYQVPDKCPDGGIYDRENQDGGSIHVWYGVFHRAHRWRYGDCGGEGS